MNSFPAILLAILMCSAAVMSGLGLFNLPDPPTAAQIAAAQTHLDSVCASCPVYEILEAGRPPWLSRTL